MKKLVEILVYDNTGVFGRCGMLPPYYGGSNGGTTQNKIVTFFSLLDEMLDIDIGLNKVVVPKNKQCSY